TIPERWNPILKFHSEQIHRRASALQSALYETRIYVFELKMATTFTRRGCRIFPALRLYNKYFGSAPFTGGAGALPSRKISVLRYKQHGLGAVKWARMLQSQNFSLEGKARSNFNDSEASSSDKASEKEATLHAALTQIGDDIGKESVRWLGRFFVRRNVSVISTGSLNLDLALGIGGLPKGRMVEIYGPEGSGKTTLALHVIAEAQRNRGQCVFIDAEHALDQSLAKAVGVKTKNLLFSQPNSGEQAFNLIDKFIRSGCVDVIVVDSVAALVPQRELDGKMGDDHMTSQSILMTQALRQLASPLSLSQTVLIFLNQVRVKFTSFGETETTSGGNALKFYASVRLNIQRTGLLKKKDQIIGSQVTVVVVKNKLAPPLKTAEFELEFGRGISSEGEVLDLGCKHGFVTKTGSLYRVNGQHFNGKENAKEYLRENPKICYELISKLREKLYGDVDREYGIEEEVGNIGGSINLETLNITVDENKDEEIELEGVADA
ncbi:hypothetical protein KI387_030728, partial [Taxus chinensis]